MFKIIILTIFFYLIYRVISKIIQTIEQAVSYLIPNKEKQNDGKSNSADIQQKPIKVQKKEVPKQKSLIVNSSEKKVIKLQKSSSHSSISFQQKPKQQSKSSILPIAKNEIKGPLTYKQFEQEYKIQAKADKQKQQIESLRKQIEDYRATIEQMQQQIDVHKRQKASYVSKIEEIIQHVIKQQEKPVVIPQNQQDLEMKALAQLTKGIDFAHQTQTKKFQKREQEFRQLMKQQQKKLQQKYLLQIQQLQNKLSLKEKQFFDLKQIKEQKKEERFQQQVHQKDDNVLLLQIQQKQQEINRLKNEKEINLIQLQFKQESIKNLQAQLSKSQTLLDDLQNKRKVQLQQLQQNKAFITTLNQQNQQIASQLRSTMQQLQLRNNQLRELKNRSSVESNDKLQSTIRLESRLQSLQEIKADLQSQVVQLNETIQKQDQQRRDQIDEVKGQLIKKHEAEIEKLNNTIQQQEEKKKEAEKKVLEVQSELQFVQIQLKSTIQSQKALNDQLNNYKTPRNQEKSISPNLSGVRLNSQVHSNKRLEEQPKEIKTEPQQHEANLLPVDRKVNYARTKIQRQASPTFQYESKEKSPQVQNKPKEKLHSTIFTGVFDRVKSPIDLRYNTPKTVVQSSIYQGGIVSEGYFGQTNILSQQNREFILAEINHLKKISAKKTRLLYRSLSKNSSKPISQFVSNVPNLLVVVQLTNKKIVGAFTQAAFNKDLLIQAQRKYASNNKAIIIDITDEQVIVNASNQQTIRYDEKSLIWGKNEFIVNSDQPLLLTCDLNCEGAVFPTNKFTNEQWINGSSPISQFQVYRIFLG